MGAQDIFRIAVLLGPLLAATAAQAQHVRPDLDGTPGAQTTRLDAGPHRTAERERRLTPPPRGGKEGLPVAEPEPGRAFRCEGRERGSGIDITLDPARSSALVRHDVTPGLPETFRLSANAAAFQLDRTTREGTEVRLRLDRLSLGLTAPLGPRPEGPPVTCIRVVRY